MTINPDPPATMASPIIKYASELKDCALPFGMKTYIIKDFLLDEGEDPMKIEIKDKIPNFVLEDLGGGPPMRYRHAEKFRLRNPRCVGLVFKGRSAAATTQLEKVSDAVGGKAVTYLKVNALTIIDSNQYYYFGRNASINPTLWQPNGCQLVLSITDDINYNFLSAHCRTTTCPRTCQLLMELGGDMTCHC